MEEYVKMTMEDYALSVLACDEEDNEEKIREMLKHLVQPDSVVPDCASMLDLISRSGRVCSLADSPLIDDMLVEYKKLDERYRRGASDISIALTMLEDYECFLRPIFDSVKGERYIALFKECDRWFAVEKG